MAATDAGDSIRFKLEVKMLLQMRMNAASRISRLAGSGEAKREDGARACLCPCRLVADRPMKLKRYRYLFTTRTWPIAARRRFMQGLSVYTVHTVLLLFIVQPCTLHHYSVFEYIYIPFINIDYYTYLYVLCINTGGTIIDLVVQLYYR